MTSAESLSTGTATRGGPVPSVGAATVDTWLGAGEVLATLHLPAAASEIGVVVCPPFGYEYTVAYRALRHFADRLAESGLAVVRYDHPGFGDSTAPLAHDSLARGASLAARALVDAGCRAVAYVGLGSGALVASLAAAADPTAAGLVLWDPVASGRHWIRQQRSMYSIALGDLAEEAPDGAVEIIGAELPDWFVDDLGRLGYDPAVVSRVPTLVALRDGSGGTLPKPLRGVAADVDVIEVDGHAEALDVSTIESRIPGESVAAVAAWLASRFGPRAGSRIAHPTFAASPVARLTRGGAPIEEHLRRIGPNALFAIETRPASAAGSPLGSDLPMVVLHNGSAEHRTGATRHQVDLARRLAAHGIRALRVDRQGTGESSAVRPGEPKMLFAKEWLDDGADVLRSLDLPRERIGVVGMCVGSWVGLVADARSASFVVAVSIRDHYVRPLPARTTVAAPPIAIGDRELRQPLAHRLVAIAKRRMPYGVMLALAERGLVQFAEPSLRRALDAGADVTLLFSPADRDIFRAHGGEKAVRRLRRSPGRLTVVEHESGDHALFSPGIRARANDEAVALALRTFGQEP